MLYTLMAHFISYNHSAAFSACRHGHELLKFKLSMMKKGDLSEYECDMVVGARLAGLA